MKIISKFKDYYDGVARSFAQKDDRIFKRVTKHETIKDNNVRDEHFDIGLYKRIENCVVGFCGELIPAICERSKQREKSAKLLWDTESALNAKEEDKKGSRFGEPHIWGYDSVRDALDDWFGKNQLLNSSRIKNLFIERRIPYFIYIPQFRGYDIIELPNLGEAGFQKVMSDYEAFLKIEQFLNNQLAPPDMVEHEISDVLKAESKGFDKFSFRKQKKV